MKTVEYWRWMTWNLQGTKMAASRHHMDEETALGRQPEAARAEIDGAALDLHDEGGQAAAAKHKAPTEVIYPSYSALAVCVLRLGE